MNKVIGLLLLLLIVNAWNWDTHENIIERVYYGLDLELQHELNLESLKQGARAPDEIFKDYSKHHYPDSYDLSLEWLDKSKSAYDNKDYNLSSYALGVASHYISDSFADPHYISKELGSLHSAYEDQGDYLIKTVCKDYNLDLKQTLESASKENYWYTWVENRDDKIPQNKIEESTKLMFSVTLNLFNTGCNEFRTKIERQKLDFFNNNVKIFSGLLIFGLMIRMIVLRKIRFF